MTATKPPGRQIEQLTPKPNKHCFIPRKAGLTGRRQGGRGSPATNRTKGPDLRPLTTFGFYRRQQAREAPPSRGEELGRGATKEEGGRGVTGSSPNKESGSRPSQGEKVAPSRNMRKILHGDRTGVRHKMRLASESDKVRKADAKGSIGAYIKQNTISKLNLTLNSNPKGLQTGNSDLVQKGQLSRVQSEGSRHQTPRSLTTEEDSINPDPGTI